MELKPLVIGDLIAKIPIIQGGMGVGISLSNLASAVAKEGGIGIISAAQIGFKELNFEENPLSSNLEALAKHLKIAKEKACGGIVGVNIMTATRKYDEYVKCAVKNKADVIISGAGLPLNLPELVKNSASKIAPIISSAKAAKVLLKLWDNRYKRTADFIVIEGPKAGGHLGFKPEEIESFIEHDNYDEEITKILAVVKEYATKFSQSIPVVFGGGVSTREDVKHYMDLGLDGVQVATKFVPTVECDAPIEYKNAYINCTKEDIDLVKSPVGMPGRALQNDFAKRVKLKKEPLGKCLTCIRECDRKVIDYCITTALVNAAKGDTENALIFMGNNAYLSKEITTVKDVINDLIY